ncbi:ATP synthase F1 subunit delta [Fulvivirga maritima]|uniref:ATP synthase F1 subunit delta n=1 Tax=Fulvivirga maritima TaxID=2904247 RepID=UPI001F49066B|nr:ATP synthase F1 subunit delta [Fulvivirga maritima]UII28506.1 ATP synthase F1 subunit delta [Fulvivirga maritima]
MTEHRAASRYAKSLLELAKEQGVLDQVHDDMLSFHKICEENREFALMLKNPVIKNNKKRAILEKVFEGKVNELTLSIFKVISRKNREALLPTIAKEFHVQYNIINGIEVASVTTAVALTPELRAQIEEMVKKISSKQKVDLVEKVDQEIIGGYILKVGDRQIDDSLKTKLKSLEHKFSQNPYIKEF